MKEYGTLSPVCRVLAHYLKTALNSIFLRILGRLKANHCKFKIEVQFSGRGKDKI